MVAFTLPTLVRPRSPPVAKVGIMLALGGVMVRPLDSGVYDIMLQGGDAWKWDGISFR